MFAQSPVMAAPIAYEVNGEQYIAVLSGWGGAYPLLQGQQSAKSGNERNVSRVLVFKLGAKGDLPALPPDPKLVIDPPADTASPATVAQGEGLYNQFCGVCHGEAAVAGGVTPDLRGSPFIAVEAWYSVVLDGALEQGGMAPFKTVLDRPKATAIRDYIACETVIGKGDWMDDVVVHDGPVVKDGFITVPSKPGLGLELNREVVQGHLAAGEKWWG